jgi:hypothetical protein
MEDLLRGKVRVVGIPSDLAIDGMLWIDPLTESVVVSVRSASFPALEEGAVREEIVPTIERNTDCC